jgi:hypothetical protein
VHRILRKRSRASDRYHPTIIGAVKPSKI